jgi:DNA-binding NtrC family response regulator
MAYATEFQKTKKSIYSILLVDDDSSLLEVIYEVLTDQDYQVTKATSGEEALEVLGIRDFDLVITDLNMGVINGIEVVKKTKELNPEKTAIIMTANQDVTFFTEASRLGVCDYLLKPFQLDDLLIRVSNCLEGV